MSGLGRLPPRRVLLINPKITSRRNARFPLSLMNLSAALEPEFDAVLIDGNLDPAAAATAVTRLRADTFAAAGITVMGGPQVATAIEVSRAIRRAQPDLPIVWGGYFPTLYPDVALNADYVDFVIRGQGERSFVELLRALESDDDAALAAIDGLSWRGGRSGIGKRSGVGGLSGTGKLGGRSERDDTGITHNDRRRLDHELVAPRLRYERLPDPRAYLVRSFLGQRTAGHQAALGCRFRCTFCGVAAMFKGGTVLPPAERLDRDLSFLTGSLGADSIQFYDHNFFDREQDMRPLLEVLARHALPWWCYARADALVNLSPQSWRLVRRSRLRMAYIGAETPNDTLLRSIRKGTKSEQTLAAVEACRRNGVIPELSFMVAPPEDSEAETERTFEFIREVKRVDPGAEIIVYVHTPLPASSVPDADRLRLVPLLDTRGRPVAFPQTPEEWTEQRWVDYACHADAPWLTDHLRRRIRDFVTVLRCRFPTIQDTRSPGWARTALRGLASWRYALKHYDRPWELTASHRLIGLLDPRVSSL